MTRSTTLFRPAVFGRLLVLALGGWLIAAGAFAQSGLGSITGTIVDQTSGRLAGAVVRLVEVSTGAVRTATSNEVGLFSLAAVPPGIYTITISRDDFKARRFADITVNSFQQVALGEISLEIAIAPSDSVEVTAARPILDLNSGVRADTIQAEQVQNIPLQGRNWTTLLKVIPGANPTNRDAISGREYASNGYADFRINGKNPQQTQVNLDGGSLVDHGSDAKTTTAPSLESIDEVSILTNNFQAEYGTRGGTVINIVTKSGTNQVRGALFDYVRNEALNATAWADNFLGNPTPTYRYNYLGGNLGGPIVKNKLFFFYNVEDFKQDIPGATQQGRVPTALERQGDFSQTRNADGTRPVIYMPGTQFSGNPVPIPNNVIPPSLIHPLGRAILNTFPLPNNSSDPNNNYVLQFERTNPRISHVAKIDWNMDDRTHVYLRYSEDDGTQVDRSISNTSGILPAAGVSRPRPDRSLAVNGTRTLSPMLVMDGLFAWSYDSVKWLPADPDGLSRSKLGLSNLPVVFPVSDDILPAMTFGPYPNWAFNRMPAYALANEWQGAATFSWVRGEHVIKFGAQHVINVKDEIDQSVNKGSYSFQPSAGSAFDTGYGPANVLVGAVSSFQQIEQVNRKNSIYRDTHAFVQDTWRATRSLTLDYGVRFYHMPTEHNRNTDETLDAVFLPTRWDPAKAPRFYVPDPRNPTLVIDPARPDQPLPSNLANVLRYTLVPGSGDPLNGVVQLGRNRIGNSGIRDPKFLLMAPRGGFAWLPFADQRTVIRGGFGWAYNRNNITDTINRFENGLGREANLAQTSFETMAAPSTVQPVAAKGFGARDEMNNNVPTVYDYSVSVQRQLLSDWVVDVAYVGNRQRHQPVSFNINAIPPGTAFDPQYIDPRNAGYNFAGPISSTNRGPALPGSNAMDSLVMRPYRGFDALMMTTNAADVTYNSLQVNVTKRLSHGLGVNMSYTLGRTRGQIENIGLYKFNWQAYTGYKLNTDRLHVLNVNYIYEVPKVASTLHVDHAIARAILNDWKFTHLLTIFSGADYSPAFTIQQANTTTNVDLSRVFMGTPDLGPRLGVVGRPNEASGDLGHQFDPSQLGVPAIFPSADGTGPRNFLRGRGSFANDISLVKQFRLHDRQRIELRANVYNVFNNVRWLNVNNSVQYKANGPTFADGFRVFNTPELNEARARANGITDPTQLFNQFRAGVGHVTLIDSTANVQPPRIIEIGVAFRF
jgi:hypothetical protein